MFEFLNNAVFSLSWPWSLAVVLSAMFVLAFFSVLFRFLDKTGAVAAFILGFIVFWALRSEGILYFLLFFLCGSVISFVTGKKENIKKTKGRNMGQVLANGFMPALAASLFLLTGKMNFIYMFCASVAEDVSDTFAGEIGRFSKQDPVSVLSFRKIQKGLSGGVTWLGCFAGFVSAGVFTVLAFLIFKIRFSFVIGLASFAGCIIDSVLGAFAQALYKDETSGHYYEEPGEGRVLVKGKPFVDNNTVNLMSNVFSSVLVLGLCKVLL